MTISPRKKLTAIFFAVSLHSTGFTCAEESQQPSQTNSTNNSHNSEVLAGLGLLNKKFGSTYIGATFSKLSKANDVYSLGKHIYKGDIPEAYGKVSGMAVGVISISRLANAGAVSGKFVPGIGSGGGYLLGGSVGIGLTVLADDQVNQFVQNLVDNNHKNVQTPYQQLLTSVGMNSASMALKSTELSMPGVLSQFKADQRREIIRRQKEEARRKGRPYIPNSKLVSEIDHYDRFAKTQREELHSLKEKLSKSRLRAKPSNQNKAFVSSNNTKPENLEPGNNSAETAERDRQVALSLLAHKKCVHAPNWLDTLDEFIEMTRYVIKKLDESGGTGNPRPRQRLAKQIRERNKFAQCIASVKKQLAAEEQEKKTNNGKTEDALNQNPIQEDREKPSVNSMDRQAGNKAPIVQKNVEGSVMPIKPKTRYNSNFTQPRSSRKDKNKVKKPKLWVDGDIARENLRKKFELEKKQRQRRLEQENRQRAFQAETKRIRLELDSLRRDINSNKSKKTQN